MTADYEENYGTMGDIVRLLEEISDKLDRNHATLKELLNETRNTNLALLNYGEDNPQKVTASLTELDNDVIVGGSVMFVGYRRGELTNHLERVAQSIGVSFKYAKGIDSPGELAAMLTNCSPGDILLLNLEEIINSNCIPLVINAIEDCCLDVKMGTGIGTRSIRLDIPKIVIHFYATTDLFVPKELNSILTSTYSLMQ